MDKTREEFERTASEIYGNEISFEFSEEQNCYIYEKTCNAFALFSAAKANEWISVEDRLPDNNEIVEVFWEDDGKNFDHDFYDEQWVNWFNCAERFNIAGGNVSEVAPYTHWRRVETEEKINQYRRINEPKRS